MKNFILSICFGVSFVLASQTASIFVKDAESFRHIKNDLASLKTGLGESNPLVDSLLNRAELIAKMNDRCSMISINEVLDDSCSHFYAVELPEFETKYMELTGELRLSSLRMGSSLAERTEQIQVCASALGGILFPKNQVLKLDGGMNLEPLNLEGAFDATYDFNLYYDSARMEQQKSLLDRWVTKCGDIVLRKDGDEFAPLFVDRVSFINDSLSKTNSNVKIVLEPEFLDFYLDMAKPVSGEYFLNGSRIFSVDKLPMGRNYSHVIVNIPNRMVNLPLGVNGKMQNFRGRVEFTSAYQAEDLIGRWIWGNLEGTNQAVAKGEISSEAVMGDSTKFFPVVKYLDSKDTSALIKSVADSPNSDAAQGASRSAASSGSSDKNVSRSWIPQIVAGVVFVGGTIMAVAFNSKAKSERDKKPADAADYDKICDNIESAQNMRTVGFGIAALGLVGFGVSFLF